MVLAVVLAGCISQGPGGDDGASSTQAPADPEVIAFFEALSASRLVTFETDHGTIRFLLYDQLMPVTAGRIGELIETGFYDNTIIHRVVDDFVIQGGDPSRTGQLGSGTTIPFESRADLLFLDGAVGLARDLDPDSGDSQWFITEKPALHLSDTTSDTAAVYGTYALFGQVVDGLHVVRAIAAEPTLPGLDRPVMDVVLEDAGLEVLESPAGLLALPPTVSTQGPAASPWVSGRPLLVFAGQPFTIRLFADVDAGAAPRAVTLVAAPAPGTPAAPDGNPAPSVTATFAAVDDDPYVFEATLTLPQAGNWSLVQTVDTRSAKETLNVRPWNEAYARWAEAAGMGDTG